MYKLFFTVVLSLLTSCITQPGQVEILIKNFKLEKSSITGLRYEHLSIINHSRGETLHVYIEGDGLPWLNRHTISSDPTPVNPLALRLMSQDPNFALYIGRPCYFDFVNSPNCSPKQWTNGRYGEDVIDSMEAAIRSVIRTHQIEKIILIGYSGGGVIASLLAERINQTQLYITIAANLDTTKWTTHHGYTPLDQSINPVSLVKTMKKNGVHLVGGKDIVVPIAISSHFIHDTGGKLVTYPDFDHICCWAENWQNMLIKLKADYWH